MTGMRKFSNWITEHFSPYISKQSEVEPDRICVIDYTGRTSQSGRVLDMKDVDIQYQFQDNGRTVKVFITEKETG